MREHVRQAKPVALYFVEDAKEFDRHWPGLGINCEFRDRAHARVWEYSFRGSYPDGPVKWCVWRILGPAHWEVERARRMLLERAAGYGFCALHVYKERPASTDEEVRYMRKFNERLIEKREAVCV